MKRFVNGEEAELTESAEVQITRLHDRLMVRTSEGTFSALSIRKGGSTLISYRGHVYVVEQPTAHRQSANVSSGEMRAPMPGLIVEVLVTAGDTVKKGEKVLVLEAMKTQQTFSAPFDGVVEKLVAEKGMQVVDGQVLAVITES